MRSINKAALAGLLVSASILAGCGPAGSKAASSGGPAPPTPVELAASARPSDEKAFLDAVEGARTAYRDAFNDLGRGAARGRRKTDICQTLGASSVKNWTGTVAQLTTNSEGKGVVEILLQDDIRVATWNNALSDIADNTLINTNSDLFHQLSSMKVGDAVKFSGEFHQDDTDCIKEMSFVSLEHSVLHPSFLITLTGAEPLIAIVASSAADPKAKEPVDAVAVSDAEIAAAQQEQPQPTTPSPRLVAKVEAPPALVPEPAPPAEVAAVAATRAAEPSLDRCEALGELGREAMMMKQSGATLQQVEQDLLSKGTYARVLNRRDVEIIVQNAFYYKTADLQEFSKWASQSCRHQAALANSRRTGADGPSPLGAGAQ